jgi:acyl dehydratase
MPVDLSFLGRTYPPTRPYEVGREKIAEFADAIGDPDPVYRERAAAVALGYPDVIAPPTFAILLTLEAGRQVFDDPALGLDFSRVVHRDQRFVHHRPIVAGDVLQVVVTVDELRVVAGNDIVGNRAEVTTVGGEPVVTAYSSLVGRAA